MSDQRFASNVPLPASPGYLHLCVVAVTTSHTASHPHTHTHSAECISKLNRLQIVLWQGAASSRRMPTNFEQLVSILRLLPMLRFYYATRPNTEQNARRKRAGDLSVSFLSQLCLSLFVVLATCIMHIVSSFNRFRAGAIDTHAKCCQPTSPYHFRVVHGAFLPASHCI